MSAVWPSDGRRGTYARAERIGKRDASALPAGPWPHPAAPPVTRTGGTRTSWLTVAVGTVVAAVAILAVVNVGGNILAPSPSVAEAVAPMEDVYLLIGNTGGEGAFVRRTPNLDDRLRAWPEGTRLRVVGAEATVDGVPWKQVEDPAGNIGWIPAEYTSPG